MGSNIKKEKKRGGMEKNDCNKRMWKQKQEKDLKE